MFAAAGEAFGGMNDFLAMLGNLLSCLDPVGDIFVT